MDTACRINVKYDVDSFGYDFIPSLSFFVSNKISKAFWYPSIILIPRTPLGKIPGLSKREGLGTTGGIQNWQKECVKNTFLVIANKNAFFSFSLK